MIPSNATKHHTIANQDGICNNEASVVSCLNRLITHAGCADGIYNLNDDLGETNNIADDHLEIVQMFREIFKEARTPSALFRFTAEQ